MASNKVSRYAYFRSSTAKKRTNPNPHSSQSMHHHACINSSAEAVREGRRSMAEEQRSEIVFFDLETTMPVRSGQGFSILEFGAILVCPRKLEELQSYSTFVRPLDLSLITSLSIRCNGITRDDVLSAPFFSDIADRVFNLLHGRIWAGHNIQRFDCRRIREAFLEIGRASPEPTGVIDSLALLTQRFGRRAGNMKMASLATYFGLGEQAHRSLEDVRLNLEVIKHCATVLFLESCLPDIFTENSWVSPKVVTRSRSGNGKAPPPPPESYAPIEFPSPDWGEDDETEHFVLPVWSPEWEREHFSSPVGSPEGEREHFSSPAGSPEVETEQSTPPIGGGADSGGCFDMGCLAEVLAEATTVPQEGQGSAPPRGRGPFLEVREVDVSSITTVVIPSYFGSTRRRILHSGAPLQLWCPGLTVRQGVSGKFTDNSGMPRLSFLADAPPELCRVLDSVDDIVRRSVVDGGSSSEWRPIHRKNWFLNSPTMRLSIPFSRNRERCRTYQTEMFLKEDGVEEKVEWGSGGDDAARVGSFLAQGMLVDAWFSPEPYDYQGYAGVRLVATKLTAVHHTHPL